MHDVESALRVIRVLLKLHQALLYAEGDDQFGLRGYHQVFNRNYVITASLPNVTVIDCVIWASYELCWIRFILEKANSDGELVYVGFQTTDEIVLSYDLDRLRFMAVFEDVEESRIFAKLQVWEVSLRC